MRSGGAVAQTIDPASAEPFDPFSDRLRGGVELARSSGIARSRFHTPYHGLSTFRRQGSILVAVHLVSPRSTEASQPQLPRFRPDGQPPESSQLGAKTASRSRQAPDAGGLRWISPACRYG